MQSISSCIIYRSRKEGVVKLFVAELVSIALFKSEFDSRFNVVWFGDYGIMNEHFIRPPVRSNGRSYKMLVMFIFLSPRSP